jgi:virginiamycin A acetyltransferase
MGSQRSLFQRVLRYSVAQMADLLTLPVWYSYQLQACLVGPARACLTISKQAAAWSGPSSDFLRRSLYRRILAGMGNDVTIGMGTVISKPTLTLGDMVYIGTFCSLGDAYVGAYTMVADHVSIISGQHGLAADTRMRDQPDSYRRVTIGADCWVGARAVVMADLGDHVVVGAGSVVTKPVAAYAIVAGNPARPIGDRRERPTQQPAGDITKSAKMLSAMPMERMASVCSGSQSVHQGQEQALGAAQAEAQ